MATLRTRQCGLCGAIANHQRGSRCPIFKEVEDLKKKFVRDGGEFPREHWATKNCSMCAEGRHPERSCPLRDGFNEILKNNKDKIEAQARAEREAQALANQRTKEFEEAEAKKKAEEAEAKKKAEEAEAKKKAEEAEEKKEAEEKARIQRALDEITKKVEGAKKEREEAEEKLKASTEKWATVVKKVKTIPATANLSNIDLPPVDVLLGGGASVSPASSVSSGAFTRLETAMERRRTESAPAPAPADASKKYPPSEIKRLFNIHNEADMVWMMMRDLWVEHPERFALRDFASKHETRVLEYTMNDNGRKPLTLGVIINFKNGMPWNARYKPRQSINEGGGSVDICRWRPDEWT
jgi:flagellar biosynthesis GTPase FlhF